MYPVFRPADSSWRAYCFSVCTCCRDCLVYNIAIALLLWRSIAGFYRLSIAISDFLLTIEGRWRVDDSTASPVILRPVFIDTPSGAVVD